MPTPDQEQFVTNVNNIHEFKRLHVEIEELREALGSLQKDRESALRWGILVLGGAVISMGTWIFNFVISGHAK